MDGEIHTKYASVLSLLEIFISEPYSLQLESCVDHPHGCGQDYIHCPCIKTEELAFLNILNGKY